jgi:L-fuconolactonase
MEPILDPHQHLWDLGAFRLPWLQDGGPLTRNFLMADYLKASEGLNVAKTIYMEVDVEPAQHVAEAEYVIALCQQDDNPMVGAVIGGIPASDDFPAYVRRFQDCPYIKGVRQVLHGEAERGYCLRPEFIRGIRLLGKAGLSFDLCLRPDELADAAELIDLCPETRFILDHCGNARVQEKDRRLWERDIAIVAERENVVCKISGVVAAATPGEWTAADLAPIVLHCAEVFGRERVMFASDWPVCTLTATYRQWVEALRAIVHDWSDADRRRLFYDNAARFYGVG